jgi:Protein of unknown function (DUF3105)
VSVRGALRATPRVGSKKNSAKRLKRPWAPYKHRELVLYLVGLALVLICIMPVPLHYWYRAQALHDFEIQADQGRPKLTKVEAVEDRGHSVLPPNTAYDYRDPFPTSGPHDRDWINAGFYESPRASAMLVHALARGMIVIYYDKPAQSVLESLKNWAGLFRGEMDGVIVIRHSGLGSEVVLTAWNKRLRLPQFDPTATAAFIEQFRGHGPKTPTR